MAHVPEELMHEKQIKVRLLDKEYEEWKDIAHQHGELHSVMSRIAHRALLAYWREHGCLPDYVVKQRA